MTRIACVLILFCLLVGGCGYRQSGDIDIVNSGYQWRSLYRQDVQSVAIPIFANRSYQRGLEFSLTESIAKQLEMRSPYKVVDQSHADTILEGQIIEVRSRTLSQGLDNALPQEQLTSVRVNFVWKDLRSGQILTERRGFERAAAFYPTLGEGRVVSHQKSIDDLALAIVQELQADW